MKCLKDSEETNHAPGKAARVNSYWKPDVCPVTGRQFFMWIEHETLGYVPTYGDVCPVTGRQFFMWIEHETLGYVPTYG
ncbi:hypothetical protein M0741_24685, partial [Salmonella enterica subsp. enterica serovar Oranienburg]|nr:hypothetical protein [Salmonella enterica subsp. enterica serovar Oranienburg]